MIFNKTIIPLALVGYEMIIPTRPFAPCWLSITSYPTRARGIIVKYFRAKWRLLFVYWLPRFFFLRKKEGVENYRPQNIFRCRFGREERRLSKLRKLCKLHKLKNTCCGDGVSLNCFAVMRCLLNLLIFFTVLRCSELPHVPLLKGLVKFMEIGNF